MSLKSARRRVAEREHKSAILELRLAQSLMESIHQLDIELTPKVMEDLTAIKAMLRAMSDRHVGINSSLVEILDNLIETLNHL